MKEFKDLPGEVWKEVKTIKGSPNKIYEVSDKGRLRGKHLNSGNVKLMKLTVLNGYYYHSFKSDKVRSYLLHRLVAEAFLKPKNKNHKFVIHLDYDKKNNLVENLAWVTEQEMRAHNRVNPNYKYERPYRRPYSKLNEDQVRKIKQMIKANKVALYKIAKEFGITHTQLNRIRSGVNWGHVKID